MNQIQNKRAKDLQKPFPGCMGRMINILDLSAGMPGTKLLNEKPYQDGSPNCRKRPDVLKKTIDPVGVQKGDKPIASDLRKSLRKRSSGAPIKMLIAQEMSRETASKQNPPNVVARLMGLDALPVCQSLLTPKRISQEGYSHNQPAAENRGYRQQTDGSYHSPLKRDTLCCAHEKEYKDVYEVWQHPSRTSWTKDQPPPKGIYNENQTEMRMTLVRQKFIEAKRLARDEKLIESKEFQDALEVLSSNRDLFLKFLEESNSLFSKHHHEIQTISPPSQTKRITVFRPSETVETIKNIDHDMNRHRRSSRFNHPKADKISPSTRIVVLKPSLGKTHGMNTIVSLPIPSPGGKDLCEGLGTDNAIGLREVDKEITRQMQECFRSNQGVEAFLTSASSNGYIGYESPIHKSKNDCIKEEGGNFSDLETLTPTGHSWDYTNRFGSPYSTSSVNRASFSPESSVITEAKKRLSERWALVASNVISREQTQVSRSGTLGEMLAIPKVKKEEGSDRLTILSSVSPKVKKEEGSDRLTILSSASRGGEQDLRVSEDNSPRNLSRSKSAPISSSVYENIESKEEVPDMSISKPIVPKSVAKWKSGKSSFKGKVSSLFFSGIKKLGREISILPPSVESDCKFQGDSAEACDNRNKDVSKSLHDGCYSSPNDGPKQDTSSPKSSSFLEKPRACENSREFQDQPSPISVLEAPFEDDANINISQSSASIIARYPQALSRSPPIESVARTLSWDDSQLGISLPSSLKVSRLLSKEQEEQERFLFVQKLLSYAGLDNENSSRFLSRWRSLDSPLDPLLLDELLDRKEEEAKCRERRSNQRLIFDCVNAALLDIGHATTMRTCPWATALGTVWKGGPDCTSVSEEVWQRVRDRFSGDVNLVADESGNCNLVADRVVKREVAGKGWAESLWSETEEFSKEIVGEVMEVLVEEALVELAGGCLH